MTVRTKLPCTVRMRCPIDDGLLGEWDLSMTHVRTEVGAVWPAHRRQRHPAERVYGGRKGLMVLSCDRCGEVLDRCDTSTTSWEGRFRVARDEHEPECTALGGQQVELFPDGDS